MSIQQLKRELRSRQMFVKWLRVMARMIKRAMMAARMETQFGEEQDADV
jgi:hypothetical protein